MTARYTLVMGARRFSSWSMRPWLVLKMADIPFAEEPVPWRRPETAARLRKVSPSAKVPVLKIAERGKTRLVWDTLAICETLAERHPKARLWPHLPAAREEARSIVAEMHSGFMDIRRALSMDVAAKLPTPALDDATRAQIGRVAEIWTGALKRHGGKSGFLFGRFSIADAFYAPVATRFETYGITLPKAAQAYADRVLDLKPMREWVAAAKTETFPVP